VLEELRRQEDGLDADEVGALLCERNGRHDRGVRCAYDSSNGQGVLKALRKKGPRPPAPRWDVGRAVTGRRRRKRLLGTSSAAESAQEGDGIPY
jgi:hypothetical protein